MPKPNMNDLLKSRMSSSKQASELASSDQAYESIFMEHSFHTSATVRELPLDTLVPFFTADIGFKPYPKERLEAFATQLQEEGLLVRIIVRPTGSDRQFEILAGHNRVNAARIAGWDSISAEIVDADDVRAVVIATSTNLIQRQNLSIVERGKAYKALLDAKNRNGQHNAAQDTFGETRQRYNARQLVAEFFGVTEYEIRKLVKLTNLIPELLEIIENEPKRINLSCADRIADYDVESQAVFVDICSTAGYKLNAKAMRHISEQCPPPTAERDSILKAWEEAKEEENTRAKLPSKTITFTRKKFEPYLGRIGTDADLEKLFLDFLRQRIG